MAHPVRPGEIPRCRRRLRGHGLPNRTGRASPDPGLVASQKTDQPAHASPGHWLAQAPDGPACCRSMRWRGWRIAISSDAGFREPGHRPRTGPEDPGGGHPQAGQPAEVPLHSCGRSPFRRPEAGGPRYRHERRRNPAASPVARFPDRPSTPARAFIASRTGCGAPWRPGHPSCEPGSRLNHALGVRGRLNPLPTPR